MKREDLNDMLRFLTVAEERSFSKAAAKLGTSQSTISHTIKKLEARMGFRVLTRTTRSVVPTEAGERLIRSLAPRIAQLETEIDELMEMRDKPTGSVRMKLSDHALESIVWPKLRPILKNYPDIKLELNSENGSKNIVEEKFDAGVCVGECLEKDMITVRIGPDWRLVAVASPEYLAKKAALETPRDLIRHDCINYRQARPRALDGWEFEKDGGEVCARVDGQLAFNTYGVMIDAAVSGYGIAYVPESLVGEEVASGKLVQVLDDWTPLFPGYYLYYPSWRLNSPAFKVVVDALRV